MVIDRYKEYWLCVKEMEFWGCEVTLKEEEERNMRTDFLGYTPGGNGIVVVELKKSNQTARQAFTELPAYSSFLRTLFSPSSKNDIMYLLISPMDERIVEQAAIHQLVYDNNKVCILEPRIVGKDLFFRYTEIDYEYLSKCNEEDREYHPYCLAGYNVPEELVDMVFSPTCAKLFLKRLYKPLIVEPDDIY